MPELSIDVGDATTSAVAGGSFTVTPEPPTLTGSDGRVRASGYAVVPGRFLMSTDPIPGTLDANGEATVELVASADAVRGPNGEVLLYRFERSGDAGVVRFAMPDTDTDLATAVEGSAALLEALGAPADQIAALAA